MREKRTVTTAISAELMRVLKENEHLRAEMERIATINELTIEGMTEQIVTLRARVKRLEALVIRYARDHTQNVRIAHACINGKAPADIVCECDICTEARAALEGGKAEVCPWHYDNDGFWETSCGLSWQFEDDGPEENNCHFCPNCGKKIAILADDSAALEEKDA